MNFSFHPSINFKQLFNRSQQELSNCRIKFKKKFIHFYISFPFFIFDNVEISFLRITYSIPILYFPIASLSFKYSVKSASSTRRYRDKNYYAFEAIRFPY